MSEKAYLDYEDIMKRYNIGVSNAKNIVASIRACCGGGKLPAGRILPSELERWEQLPLTNEVRR